MRCFVYITIAVHVWFPTHIHANEVPSILASTYEPFVYCNSKTSESVLGIEIEIVDEVLSNLGLMREIDYKYKCISEANQLYSMLIKNQNVVGGVSGFTIGNYITEEYGLAFTQPYMENPISFVARNEEFTIILFIAKAFSWEFLLSWLAFNILCTVLIFYFEKKYFTLREIGFFQYFHFFGLRIVKLKQIEARLLSSVHLIVTIVIFSIFVSMLIEGTSLQSKRKGIISAHDLIGKTVVTFPEFADIVEGYGIKAEKRLDLNAESLYALLNINNITATAIDDLTSQVMIYKYCDTYIAAKLEEQILGVAMLFNPAQKVIDMNAFNEAIVNVSTRVNYKTRIPKFFEKVYGKKVCDNNLNKNSDELSIRFNDIKSLWVPILFIGFCGFVFTAWWRLKRYFKRKKRASVSEILSPKSSNRNKQYSRGVSKLGFVNDSSYLSLAGRAKYDSRLIYNTGIMINDQVFRLSGKLLEDYQIRFGSLLLDEKNRKKYYGHCKQTLQGRVPVGKFKKFETLSPKLCEMESRIGDKSESIFSADFPLIEVPETKKPAQEFRTKKSYF